MAFYKETDSCHAFDGLPWEACASFQCFRRASQGASESGEEVYFGTTYVQGEGTAALEGFKEYEEAQEAEVEAASLWTPY